MDAGDFSVGFMCDWPNSYRAIRLAVSGIEFVTYFDTTQRSPKKLINNFSSTLKLVETRIVVGRTANKRRRNEKKIQFPIEIGKYFASPCLISRAFTACEPSIFGQQWKLSVTIERVWIQRTGKCVRSGGPSVMMRQEVTPTLRDAPFSYVIHLAARYSLSRAYKGDIW